MKTRFPYTSRAEWLSLIRQSLNGKEINTLDLEIEPGLSISPFQHLEDIQPQQTYPLGGKSQMLEIGAILTPSPSADLVQDIKDSLNFGANVLQLPYDILSQNDRLEHIFTGVHLPFTHIEFYPYKQISIQQRIEAESLWVDFLQRDQNTLPLSTLFHWSPKTFVHRYEMAGAPPFHTKTSTSLTRWVQIDIELTTPSEGISEAMAEMVRLYEMRIWSEEEFMSRIVLSLTPSNNFLINIASVRALKIVLANVMEELQLSEFELPILSSTITEEPIRTDVRLEYIPLTYKAMSVILGGVNRIFVRASQNTGESRRITLNLLHLLTLESQFNVVQDPAAGSYYLERMTKEIATQSWNKLHQKLYVND